MTLLDLSKFLTTLKHWMLLFIQMFCIRGFTRMYEDHREFQSRYSIQMGFSWLISDPPVNT